VAPHEAYFPGEAVEQNLDRGRGLPAVGTFEVAELDERDRRMLRSQDVVGVADRNREMREIHDGR
jgi:hypothetical protein